MQRGASLDYAALQRKIVSHPIRQTEVPDEHYLSLPLPTKRWGEPAFAIFSCPWPKNPSSSPEIGLPDQWWVMDANGFKILIFARTSVYPFMQNKSSETSLALDKVQLSIDELELLTQSITTLIEANVASFFSGESSDGRDTRSHLAELLQRRLGRNLMPIYRGLVPDFFQWLQER